MTMRKCSECGFLAVRRLKDLVIEEASDLFRENATIQSHGNVNLHDEYPVCFMRVISFRKIIDQKTSRPEVAAEIKTERPCDEFTEWIQGSSPKEHAEMIQQKALLDYQRQREQDDKAWRERQATQDHAWRTQQAEREREWRKEDRHTAMTNLLVAAGVGLLGGIVTLIAASKLPWFGQ